MGVPIPILRFLLALFERASNFKNPGPPQRATKSLGMSQIRTRTLQIGGWSFWLPSKTAFSKGCLAQSCSIGVSARMFRHLSLADQSDATKDPAICVASNLLKGSGSDKKRFGPFFGGPCEPNMMRLSTVCVCVCFAGGRVYIYIYTYLDPQATPVKMDFTPNSGAMTRF